MNPRRPAIGGLVPYSSVDWPGQLAAVVFIGGCPWRCDYCHNPHLQQRHIRYDWAQLLAWLPSRRGLLDAVVFSGGEPLSERQLPAMLNDVRALGFRLALHTAGIYPDRLAPILPLLDWVGLDIKSDAAGYDTLTGRGSSHIPVQRTLALLLASEVPFECRTTWHPSWLSEDRLLALAHTLADQGVGNYALQPVREGGLGRPSPLPTPDTHAALSRLFNHFTCRTPA